MRSILRRIKMSLHIPISSILYTHTLLELDYSISTYFSIIQLVLQHVGYMGYRDTGIQGVSGVLVTWGYRDTGCIRSIGYMGMH